MSQRVTRKTTHLNKFGFVGKYTVRIKTSSTLDTKAKQFLSEVRKGQNKKKPSKVKRRRNTTEDDSNGSKPKKVVARRFTTAENVINNAVPLLENQNITAPMKKVSFNPNVMVHELMNISKKNIPFAKSRPRSASTSGEGLKWPDQSTDSISDNENVSISPAAHDDTSQVQLAVAEKSSLTVDSQEIEIENEIGSENICNQIEINIPDTVEPIQISSLASCTKEEVPTAKLIDIDSFPENENSNAAVNPLIGDNWIDEVLGFNSNDSNIVAPIQPFKKNEKKPTKRPIPDLLPLKKKTGSSMIKSTAGNMIISLCDEFDAEFLLPDNGVCDNGVISLDFQYDGDFGKCEWE